MRTLLLSVALLTTGCLQPAFSQGTPDAGAAASVGRADLDVRAFAAQHSQGVRLIDVRSAGEYRSGHIPGAIHIPMQMATPDAPEIAAHPKDEPLYVVCEVGGRSSRVADQLARAGYRVVNVSGGTAAWRRAGLDLAR